MLTLCHYDDGKEKSESHECSFREFDKSKQWAAISLNRSITELTGYGENKEDAIEDLREQIDRYLDEVKDFINNMYYWTNETIVEIDGLGNIIEGEPL